MMQPKEYTLFRFNRVPVVARPSFFPAPFLLWGLLAWLAGIRKPGRPWLNRLLLGAVQAPLALSADLGHAMAHTLSARQAGAPMQKILLSSGMPRTLYQENDLPSQTHIRRSIGGPLFSLSGFALSLLWRRLTRPRSLDRELADVACASHAFILVGSLAPLPMVDGGIILKWKLVQRGRSPEAADRAVRRVSLASGTSLLGLGALLALLGRRQGVAGLLAAGGVSAIAAGTGLLK
jgi:hypothetical protein